VDDHGPWLRGLRIVETVDTRPAVFAQRSTSGLGAGEVVQLREKLVVVGGEGCGRLRSHRGNNRGTLKGCQLFELESQVAIAPVSRAPLAEVPAQPLLIASLFCDKSIPECSNVVILPGDDEGEVQLFGVTRHSAISITAQGRCTRRVEIPGQSLAMIRKRHADADHIALVEIPGDFPTLALRSYSAGMTLAIELPEGAGGLDQAQIDSVLRVLQDSAEPRATTHVCRSLLRQVLGSLGGTDRIRISQRARGLVLTASADGWQAQILLMGLNNQPES
jgi:hypothetical protein